MKQRSIFKALGATAILTLAACGGPQNPVASSGALDPAGRAEAPNAEPTAAELRWAASNETWDAVEKKYGVEWPKSPPRTLADGLTVKCIPGGPLADVDRQIKALTDKYGPEIQEFVKNGSDGPANQAARSEAGAHYKAGRAAQLLCDNTVVWLDMGLDADYEVRPPYQAYDAPAGGNRLGTYDPARPTQLGE